jgi:EAL domain-containing protein (putative c-di-GMP-specific phosphodiesterase class I)
MSAQSSRHRHGAESPGTRVHRGAPEQPGRGYAADFDGAQGLRIRIAIDNFGTGYSSLATLQRFPLDTIKIDRSLIRDITGPADETGLANAIIAIGKSLSLTVVAQGVETRDQAEYLRTHACDELQGFYFERPLPAESRRDCCWDRRRRLPMWARDWD